MAQEITTVLVKTLRDKTGVGMMDCKKALIEASGNIEEAEKILRKKGVAVASKRAGNVTEHGVIHGSIDKDYQSGTLVEIGCETDFAAKTKDMQQFAEEISQAAARSEKTISEVSDLLGLSVSPQLDVQGSLENITAKIAEKIEVSRTTSFRTDGSGLVNLYIHPGSLLGSMILFQGDTPFSGATREEIATLAKDICMHIAVTNPKAIGPDDLDPSILNEEMEIARAQLTSSGKPANIIDKIIDGKMQKFYEEVCLLNQKFIKDEKKSIATLLNEASKSTNVKLTIANFVRFQITAGS